MVCFYESTAQVVSDVRHGYFPKQIDAFRKDTNGWSCELFIP